MAKRLKFRSRLFEELASIVDKLSAESLNGVPIVVEGRRDKEGLRRAGVRGEIIQVKSIKGLRRFFEQRDVKRVILLLDLDSEGERLMKTLIQSLEGVVGEIDLSYRRRLMEFKRYGLIEIESIDKLLERLRPVRR
ncbi:MAG: toprim domain-containing protein [Thaumarchaeota archaeon]|nr:toprim domain-containing protein [Nitrososphaerota archaeon]